MLDDFSKPSNAPQSRRRFATSLALSLTVCAAGGAAIVHATSGVKPMTFETEPESIPLPPQLRPQEPKLELPPSPTTREPRIDKPKRPRVPTHIVDSVLPDGNEELVATAPDVTAEQAPSLEVNLAPAPPPSVAPKRPSPISKPVDGGGNHYDRLKYPPLARRNGVSGVVVVRFDVLTDGSVTHATIVSGPAEFHAVVLAATAEWKFKPAQQDGKAVLYQGLTKNVVFRLEDS